MIPYFTTQRQYEELKDEIDSAIKNVFDSGVFIYGNNMKSFESEFSSYCGREYGIGVGNGTDAIQLALMVLGIKHGDEVIVPVNTAMPTAAAVSTVGAKPVFVDIDENSFNIDPKKIETKITPRTKVIIPVHLYGQSADMDEIKEIADKHDLRIIEDCAQAHGAEYGGNKVPIYGIGCFSFYPTKNIGAYGDGGMIVTNDKTIKEKLELMRDCGQEKRYYYKTNGINSRLDEIHAAILRVKLKYLDGWIEKRRKIAKVYNTVIENGSIEKPKEMKENKHTYHLYVIRSENRNKLMEHLKRNGIDTLIHYPIPLHLQEVYSSLGGKAGDFPIAEKISKKVLSIPMFPELKIEEAEEVGKFINTFV